MSTPKVPRRYLVGKKEEGADFTEEEISLLAYQLATWFGDSTCDRNYPDPLSVAKQKISECLLGKTADGKMWINCPEEFEARIRTKTLFDMKTGTGVPAARRKSPRAVKKEQRLAAEAAAKGVTRTDPTTLIVDQEVIKQTVVRDVLDTFPELDNPAHLLNVQRLGTLHAQASVIDAKLALSPGPSIQKELLDNLLKIDQMIDRTMKSLGIHPQQIKQQVGDHMASSVAEFVALAESDPEFRRRNKLWSLELALLLWWMSAHPNGRGTGPNIHPFEVWHMTRGRAISFTCVECGRHYPHLVEGFEPQELFDYLRGEGVLIRESLEELRPFVEATAGTALPARLLEDVHQEIVEYFTPPASAVPPPHEAHDESPGDTEPLPEGEASRGDDARDSGAGRDSAGGDL